MYFQKYLITNQCKHIYNTLDVAAAVHYSNEFDFRYKPRYKLSMKRIIFCALKASSPKKLANVHLLLIKCEKNLMNV